MILPFPLLLSQFDFHSPPLTMSNECYLTHASSTTKQLEARAGKSNSNPHTVPPNE